MQRHNRPSGHDWFSWGASSKLCLSVMLPKINYTSYLSRHGVSRNLVLSRRGNILARLADSSEVGWDAARPKGTYEPYGKKGPSKANFLISRIPSSMLRGYVVDGRSLSCDSALAWK